MSDYTSLQKARAWVEQARQEADEPCKSYLFQTGHDLDKMLRQQLLPAINPCSLITTDPPTAPPPPTISHSFSHLDSVVDSSRQTLILVHCDFRNVGKVTIGWHGEVCELVGLFIGEAYQGKGLGRALLQYALLMARAQNVKVMNLNVQRRNHRAITLYLRMGFRVVSHFALGDVPEYLMARFIAPPICQPPLLPPDARFNPDPTTA